MANAIKITLTASYSCVLCVRCVTSVFMIFTSSSARRSCLSARCSSFACCSASFSSLSSLCASSNCSLFNIRSTSVSDLTAGVLLLFFFPELKEEPPSEISSLGVGEGLNELGVNNLEVDIVVCAKVRSSGPFASPRRGGLEVSSLPKTRSMSRASVGHRLRAGLERSECVEARGSGGNRVNVGPKGLRLS